MLFKTEINKVIPILENGKTILYPTDTVYGIGCDATNSNAIKKIYQIKQRNETKHLIILVDSFEMLQNYVKYLPKKVIHYLSNVKKPTTVIYKNPKNLAKNLIAIDKTIAIRVVSKGFVAELIKVYKKPIISTSANVSGTKTPLSFNDISKTIKKEVDFIVQIENDISTNKSSKIIRFDRGRIIVLRE